MPTTRCYLVRHAQTVWNCENRIQGYSDVPLSPFGHEQAQRLAAFFASRRLTRIFTSPLQRSRETAVAIAAGPVTYGRPASHGAGNGHGVSPVVEPELAEMRLGAWEGLTPAEVDAKFDGAYQRWRTKPSSVRIPQAERLEAFRARVQRTLEKILGSLEGGDCVVVSHGGVIAALIADVLGADYDALLRRLRLDNAGITALECGSGAPHLLWVNSISHLATLAQPPGETWF